MANEIGIERQLLADFLDAVEKRQIEVCESLLNQLRQMSIENPDAGSWYAYLSAILIDVRDSDWAAAERAYQEVLQLAHISPFLRGQALISLGISYWHQGRWKEAEGANIEALKIYTDIHEVFEQVKTQNNLAAIYWSGFNQGDFDVKVLHKAEAFCKFSLSALDDLAETPVVIGLYASVWNTLGMTCMGLGLWEKAIFSYEQMLNYHSRSGNGFGMGIAYSNLGEIYHRQGDALFAKTLSQYEKALAIFQEGKHLNEALDTLANLGALYATQNQYTESLKHYAEAIRLSERVRSVQTSEEARAGFFSTINNIFANAILTCWQLEMTTQAFNYVEQARSRAFLDLLDAGAAELERDIGASPLTLAEVQQALPEDALLFEYFTTGLIEAQQDSSSELVRHRFPAQKTLLFAITRHEAHLVDAGISPNDLYSQDQGAMVEKDLLQPHMRRALYGRLIAPFQHLLAQKKTLYLVPHGPLHYVPFQALLAPDDTTLLSAHGPQLIYAPSATVLLRNSAPQAKKSSNRRGKPSALPCLAVGHNGGAVQLHFAEDEAHSVAKLLQGHALVGHTATKANILAHAAQCQILHLSCHGTFDPQSPLDSALHLANGETLTAREVITQLRLDCELVTLSACESGRSQVRRGDEQFGLVRAFISAGAAAMIVTQWRVDERSTHILMERFYQNVRQKMRIPQALQEAQIYLRLLTRAEAEQILQRLKTESENWAKNSPTESATTWLKSDKLAQNNTLLPSANSPMAEQADLEMERVFDDPYHWAPFVLIGGHSAIEASTP